MSVRDDFLLSEYNQIFSEIRTINDKISAVSKFYVTLLTSLIVYVFVGILNYIDNPDKAFFSVNLLYACFGCLLTGAIYLLGLIASRQYAVSKKHRVRYWKAIHSIRKKISDIDEDYGKALILPKDSGRPNVSSGEIVVSYMFVILNLLLSCFIYWFILIVISTRGKSIIFNYFNYVNSFSIFMLIFMPLLFLLPANCIYISKQIYLSRHITFSNPFPDFSKTKKAKIIKYWKKSFLRKNQKYFVSFCIFVYVCNSIFILSLPKEAFFFYYFLVVGLIFLLIFCIWVIHLYPFFSPSVIRFLCKKRLKFFAIMPCIMTTENTKCAFNQKCSGGIALFRV